MSSPEIHKYLAIAEAKSEGAKIAIVSEGEALRYAKERLSRSSEADSLLDKATIAYSNFSDSNAGMRKAYPEKTRFEVKHGQIKDMLLILIGVSLLQKRDGVQYAVTVKTDTDGEYHYFSDAIKGMRYRETLGKAFNAKKGVRAKGYWLLRDDPFVLPILALAVK
jgi:hypothetical protein